MLILARREGETLRLTYQDISIRIVVTDIKGSKTKIGIEAPLDVEVVREELLAYGTGADE